MHEKVGLNFQPLFFYSHNPNIPGYLNTLGIEDKFGEILNDSMECCFINTEQRASKFITENDGSIKPVIQYLDSLSVILGNTLLYGIKKTAEDYEKNKNTPSEEESIEQLVKAIQLAKKGLFSGVLGENSPTWSEGKKFLEKWPKHLNWTTNKPTVKTQYKKGEKYENTI